MQGNYEGFRSMAFARVALLIWKWLAVTEITN